jgi:penicillin amidase
LPSAPARERIAARSGFPADRGGSHDQDEGALLALAALLALPGASLAHRPKTKAETVKVASLKRPAKVLRDTFGVPHVFAKSEHDAYFMVGYLHAQDRLFQMDSSRRQASGTLAELLGPAALESDVPLRTLGLHRAAVRSMAAISPRVAHSWRPTRTA